MYSFANVLIMLVTGDTAVMKIKILSSWNFNSDGKIRKQHVNKKERRKLQIAINYLQNG